MKPRGILKKARRRRIPDSIIRGRRTESGTLCRIVKRLCPDDLHPVLAASLVSPPGYVQLITARFLSPRNPPTPREIRTLAQPDPARPGWPTVDPEIKCSPHSSTLCAALWEQTTRRFAVLANFWKKTMLPVRRDAGEKVTTHCAAAILSAALCVGRCGCWSGIE